jgi:hypothetical protein
MPISQYYSMEFDSFKDSYLFYNHNSALNLQPTKRSLRGVTFIPIGDFYNLIQISDIGDLFMQSFSFESDKEIDQEISSFHSELREDYFYYFEEACFDPLVDTYLNKNIRTSKYSKSHYKIHNATTVKACIYVHSIQLLVMTQPLFPKTDSVKLSSNLYLILNFLGDGPKYM